MVSPAEGAVDATGLEMRQASAHYINHRHGQYFRQRYWMKLTVVCHTGSYLFVGSAVSRGPSNDAPQFAPAMRQAAENVTFDRILADAAYDSEAHHRLCREQLGVRSTSIPLNPRGNPQTVPKTKYRRQMHTRFFCRIYRHRSHVESAISQDKRVLGSALRARSDESRTRESFLRVLTHDLMILRSSLFKVSTEPGQPSAFRSAYGG